MNIAETYLRKHLGENDAFDSVVASIHEIEAEEAEMERKLDNQFADDCRSVYYEICWDDCDGGLYGAA